jgi:hypothetical protein
MESEDYYFNENGYLVFTETYHKKRGYCCGNGCKHCTYNYAAVVDITLRNRLIKDKTKDF